MDNVSAVIVEDEFIAAEYLKEILQRHGIEVLDIVDTGKEAIKTCIAKKPDIVFMDIMLADNISGSEAALAISREIQTNIIFLTAYVEEEMVDYAVASNAVGYLTKPYNEAQIIATVRMAMHRKGVPPSLENTAPEQKRIHLLHGYDYDPSEQKLFKEGQEVPMSPKALRLIDLLCQKPNVSVSNEQISMHVYEELVNDKTLRSLIFRIRHQIGDDIIKNISGTGYMICTAETLHA